MARLLDLTHGVHGVALVDEDGSVGMLLRPHWTRWIAYFVWAPLLSAASFFAVRWVWQAFPAFGIPVGIFLLGILGKVVILWALDLAERFVLVTQANVYHCQRERLFFRVINKTPVSEGARFRSHIAGCWYTLAGMLGVRSFTMTTEGDKPEVVLPYSNATQDDLDHINALTAERT